MEEIVQTGVMQMNYEDSGGEEDWSVAEEKKMK